jgi:PPP family 3-phenylpropionic acid transporter
MVGVLLGIYEGAGIAGPFVFGYAADRWGSYRGGIIATYLLSAAAAIPLTLFIHPAASAVFIALLAFSFRSGAPLLDAMTTVRLGQGGNYGKIRGAGSISFIVMVSFLQWTPFLRPNTAKNIGVWITLTSLAAVVPALFLPRTGPRPRMAPHSAAGRTAFPPGAASRRRGRFRLSGTFFGGFAIIFLSRLAMAPVYTFFPLYLTEVLHWDAVGLMFALASVSEVPCMFIAARLLRRFGPLPLLALSALGTVLRLGIYAFLPFKGALLAAQFLHALCFGLFHPAAVAFMTAAVPPERRALGMSIYLSLGSGLPTLIGNVLGGAMVEHTGYTVLFASFIAFAAAALIIYAVPRYTRGNHV